MCMWGRYWRRRISSSCLLQILQQPLGYLPRITFCPTAQQPDSPPCPHRKFTYLFGFQFRGSFVYFFCFTFSVQPHPHCPTDFSSISFRFSPPTRGRQIARKIKLKLQLHGGPSEEQQQNAAKIEEIDKSRAQGIGKRFKNNKSGKFTVKSHALVLSKFANIART